MPIPKPDVTQDPRWERLVARDPAADGTFWFSVRTTGIYCRPSCPSRAANPANVRLHDTIADARAAGFRACRRCDPDGVAETGRTEALVTKACRIIEQSEIEPSLHALARAVRLSPSYFHRLFKSVTGVTPKHYADEQRARRLREAIGTTSSVTTALYEAGYGSSSRFYAASNDVLGMTPSQYRAGAPREEIRFAVGQCSLGAVLVASSRAGVAAVLLGDDPAALLEDLQRRFARAALVGADADYERVVAQVIGLIEAPRLGHDLPLDIRGTLFQRRVWAALRQIPPGETRSYAAIAQAIGQPRAVRAVAGACAANAIAVAIPCHRVVRLSGDVSGYAWGIARKQALLGREAAIGGQLREAAIGQ